MQKMQFGKTGLPLQRAGVYKGGDIE